VVCLLRLVHSLDGRLRMAEHAVYGLHVTAQTAFACAHSPLNQLRARCVPLRWVRTRSG
jgi:hypothetical protein